MPQCQLSSSNLLSFAFGRDKRVDAAASYHSSSKLWLARCAVFALIIHAIQFFSLQVKKEIRHHPLAGPLFQVRVLATRESCGLCIRFCAGKKLGQAFGVALKDLPRGGLPCHHRDAFADLRFLRQQQAEATSTKLPTAWCVFLASGIVFPFLDLLRRRCITCASTSLFG